MSSSFKKKIYISLILVLAINSCRFDNNSIPESQANDFSIAKYYVKKFPYIGHYKIGNTYTIQNKFYTKPKSFTPKRDDNYDEVGVASWYGEGDGFHGKPTANGDIFNKDALTAAHKTLPLPCITRITNLENGRSIVVMINDRGPFAKDRLVDLSAKSAELLEMKNKGHAKVRVQYLPSETEKLLSELSLTNSKSYVAQVSRSNLAKPPFSKYSISKNKQDEKSKYYLEIENINNSEEASEIINDLKFISVSITGDNPLLRAKKIRYNYDNYSIKIGPYFGENSAKYAADYLKTYNLTSVIITEKQKYNN